jgi:hypothetical protein
MNPSSWVYTLVFTAALAGALVAVCDAEFGKRDERATKN